MAIHMWKCDGCGAELEVVRGRDDYAQPPTIEEGGVCNCDERRGATPHKWEKRLGAFKVVRGPGWRTSKGNH